MADQLSIASGIAGLVSLSSSIVVAGYKYGTSVSTAPEDFKSLIRETAALSTMLSQLVSHSLSKQAVQQSVFYQLKQQRVLEHCEETLRQIEMLIFDFEPVSGHYMKNALNTVSWPFKQKDIASSRESLSRLYASLHAAISIDNASALVRLESKQDRTHEAIINISQTTIQANEHKILDWLSSLDPNSKHRATTHLHQPNTSLWLLEEQSLHEWLGQGTFIWLHGPSGIGKTILMYALKFPLPAFVSS